MRLGRVQWVLTQISVSCPTQASSLAQDIRMSRSNSGVFVCVGAGVGVLKHCSCYILLFFNDMETYPHHWPFVTGIHRSTVDFIRPAKRRFMIPLILAWTGCWTNIRVTGDLRRHDAHVIISVTFQRYIVHQCTIGFTKSFLSVCKPRVHKLVYLHTRSNYWLIVRVVFIAETEASGET